MLPSYHPTIFLEAGKGPTQRRQGCNYVRDERDRLPKMMWSLVGKFCKCDKKTFNSACA